MAIISVYCVKTKIVEEGCTSNIGKVVTNENLNIK